MKLLTTTAAAQILGISSRRVREMIATGLLTGSKHGRDWMVTEESVKARAKNNPGPGQPRKS